MNSDDPHITIADLRVLYCVKGVKQVFAECQLDFPDFIRNGAKASDLRGHGHDGIIDRVVESIKAREADRGR